MADALLADIRRYPSVHDWSAAIKQERDERAQREALDPPPPDRSWSIWSYDGKVRFGATVWADSRRRPRRRTDDSGSVRED